MVQKVLAMLDAAPSHRESRASGRFCWAPRVVLILVVGLLVAYALHLRSSPVAIVVGALPCVAMATGAW